MLSFVNSLHQLKLILMLCNRVSLLMAVIRLWRLLSVTLSQLYRFIVLHFFTTIFLTTYNWYWFSVRKFVFWEIQPDYLFLHHRYKNTCKHLDWSSWEKASESNFLSSLSSVHYEYIHIFWLDFLKEEALTCSYQGLEFEDFESDRYF